MPPSSGASSPPISRPRAAAFLPAWPARPCWTLSRSRSSAGYNRLMRGLAVGALGGLLLLVATRARAGDAGEIGVLERQALDEGLATRGLSVEPSPAGKTIGQIHIVT